MRDKTRSLSRVNQVRLLVYLYILRLTELRPVDLLFPVTLAQAASMIIFLPSHNLRSFGTVAIVISAFAMLPGALLSMRKKTATGTTCL